MIQFNPNVFFIGALLLLILPLDWLAAVMIAAVFHELCHISALYALKGCIYRINVQTGGCVIETGRMAEWKQFISILAGPAGSCFLLLFCHVTPKIAICGLIQCFFNLIPVFPLDGGRLLRLLLYRFCPRQAEMVMDIVAIVVCILLDCLAIRFISVNSAEPWPLLLATIWNIRFLPRKIPCKPPKIGVQ